MTINEVENYCITDARENVNAKAGQLDAGQLDGAHRTLHDFADFPLSRTTSSRIGD
jgi:hypothetical protein